MWALLGKSLNCESFVSLSYFIIRQKLAQNIKRLMKVKPHWVFPHSQDFHLTNKRFFSLSKFKKKRILHENLIYSCFYSYPLTIVLTFVRVFSVVMFDLFLRVDCRFRFVYLSSCVIQFDQEKFRANCYQMTLLYLQRLSSCKLPGMNLRVSDERLA